MSDVAAADDRKKRKIKVPGISAQFTTRAWALIPLGVALNFVGNTLTQVLHIPLFLNVIGTILVSVLAGPWVGALTGAVSGILNNITNPLAIPFFLVQVGIALVVGAAARRGFFRSLWKVIIVGIVVTVVAVLISSPLSVILFGGVTGRGSDIITGVFLATGGSLLGSVMQANFIVEIADKVASVIIAYYIARSVPARFRPKYGRLVLPD